MKPGVVAQDGALLPPEFCGKRAKNIAKAATDAQRANVLKQARRRVLASMWRPTSVNALARGAAAKTTNRRVYCEK